MFMHCVVPTLLVDGTLVVGDPPESREKLAHEKICADAGKIMYNKM